jgi:cyanophycinase
MKGKLLLIGGNVDKGTVFETGEPSQIDYLKFFEQGILERTLLEIKQGTGPIEIITSASVIPEEIGEEYKQAFKRLGKENVGVLNPTSKEEADRPEVLKRLEKCSALMFSGGDQRRMEKIFSGTIFLKTLKERLQSEGDFLVSGTSAGAMGIQQRDDRRGKRNRKDCKRRGCMGQRA